MTRMSCFEMKLI